MNSTTEQEQLQALFAEMERCKEVANVCTLSSDSEGAAFWLMKANGVADQAAGLLETMPPFVTVADPFDLVNRNKNEAAYLAMCREEQGHTVFFDRVDVPEDLEQKMLNGEIRLSCVEAQGSEHNTEIAQLRATVETLRHEVEQLKAENAELSRAFRLHGGQD